ncbi:MAG: 50S ribosomal protein L23 [Clostridiales bacterium]|jgi:large subunit ribosomal protein L23|nr:50S ribosomal protein L23 [Clostridiales bacterium]
MRRAEDIIISPHITEKSNDQLADGKYTFIVDTRATKTEIRQAAEKLFSVRVLKVNTANFAGKVKRLGVHIGARPKWKKAVVKIDTDPKVRTYKEKGGKVTASSKKLQTSIEEYGVLQ